LPPKKNLKSSNLPAGRQVRKGRFCGRAEGRSGGNSARPTNFGRNQFEFFQKHTAKEPEKMSARTSFWAKSGLPSFLKKKKLQI
jgi:hypothetical protein